MTRTKFTLTQITEYAGSAGQKTLVFTPQYDPSIAEDKLFSKYTPSGRFEMTVTNAAVLEKMELGKAYYVDVTSIDVTPAA